MLDKVLKLSTLKKVKCLLLQIDQHGKIVGFDKFTKTRSDLLLVLQKKNPFQS